MVQMNGGNVCEDVSLVGGSFLLLTAQELIRIDSRWKEEWPFA